MDMAALLQVVELSVFSHNPNFVNKVRFASTLATQQKRGTHTYTNTKMKEIVGCR